MTNTFSVKNFEKFQHYKDRTPPWIKLYNELLDDYEFGCLPDASKMHLIAIWLLASRSDNRIPLDAEWVGRRINATEAVDLQLLVDAGFIYINQSCSNVLADRLQDARPEREREGEEEEEPFPTERPAAAAEAEREFFAEGKKLLGKTAGGLLAKLKNHHGLLEGRRLLEMSRPKQDRREWLAATMTARARDPTRAAMDEIERQFLEAG